MEAAGEAKAAAAAKKSTRARIDKKDNEAINEAKRATVVKDEEE
jgi:small subunit ribosomal protein S2